MQREKEREHYQIDYNCGGRSLCQRRNGKERRGLDREKGERISFGGFLSHGMAIKTAKYERLDKG